MIKVLVSLVIGFLVGVSSLLWLFVSINPDRTQQFLDGLNSDIQAEHNTKTVIS